MWTKLIGNAPVLMVGYASGLVTFWDLERCVRTHDLPLNPDLGPVLIGMRLRAEKVAHGSASSDAPQLHSEAALEEASNPPSDPYAAKQAQASVSHSEAAHAASAADLDK